MKRQLITLLSILFICCSSLQAQEIRQFMNTYCGFTIYDDNEWWSHYLLYEKCTIDSIDYVKEMGNRYAYRQDGNKIYCYTIAEEKETLVMDFGLEISDTFALYDGLHAIVEQVSDTVMNKEPCKTLYLRGVEQPDFTDVWIEGIGSLRYGINPPQVGETRLIFMEDDELIYKFNFQYNNVRGMTVRYRKVDEWEWENWREYEAAQNNYRLTFDLRNDTLHIGGYIGDFCITTTTYLVVREGEEDIWCATVEYPGGPEAESIVVKAIDVKIPGFTRERYTVHLMGRTGVVTQGDTSVDFANETPHDSPYYDLQGRPVANPTRGIYIKDGRKMIFNSEF